MAVASMTKDDDKAPPLLWRSKRTDTHRGSYKGESAQLTRGSKIFYLKSKDESSLVPRPLRLMISAE